LFRRKRGGFYHGQTGRIGWKVTASMLDFVKEAIGPFGATFALCLIGLGIVAMLREGPGDEDRRSFSSALASSLGMAGIVAIPLSSLVISWGLFQPALLAGHRPAIAGCGLAGVLATVVLGRAVFQGRRK
jgi:hypothetical protein